MGPLAQFGLRHWPPIFCHVLLLHQPGTCATRFAQELEDNQGVQKRRVPSAKVSRREGGSLAFASSRRQLDQVVQGASRLHRCWPQWPLQGQPLPLLSSCLVFLFLAGARNFYRFWIPAILKRRLAYDSER